MISSRILSQVIQRKLKEESVANVLDSTINFLSKNHLLYLLPNIVRHLESDTKKVKDFGTINIVSSHEQTEDTIEIIKSKIRSWGGVDYKVSVDPSLLSGVVVSGRNRILDASLKTSLKQLKALLTK